MDTTTYALCKKAAASAVSGVKSMSVDGQTLTINTKDSGVLKMVFPTPADGVSVTDIDVNDKNQIVFTMSDGTEITSGVIPTVKGDKGDKGDKLTFSDLTDADKQSLKGQNGYSPTISITDITGGHKVTVTNENGSNSFNVMNGEAFTYDDFTAEQLENLKGTDGFSPTVTITEATGRHTVSFTDKDGVKSFVVKDGSALDVENYYTKDEVDTALTAKANADAIPTVPVNVSELNNDENYIKNTVDNLVHYYNKADTYTKTEVNGLISNIQKLTSQIVDELPTEDIDSSVIYLIKQDDTSAYMQYMYINGAFAELGSTQVDLSDYYKKSEVDTKLADKADKTELPTVPTLISAFTNDANYLTEYTETDPTVPAWAKASTKPSYTAAEVGALPEDTEIPIFTNKTVLDGITAEKVADWDETVTDKHSHTNKAVIDKFTESDDGTVLYNGEQIASGNLWHGTKAEYDALAEKDVDTTYVVTDEEDTIAGALIDDDVTDATNKTWSAKKISDSIISYILMDTTKDIDLNDYVETGYYTPNKSFSTGWFTHSILNAPTNGWLPAGGFALEVKTFDNTSNSKWCTQVLYSYVGTDNNSAPMYTRTFFYDGSKVTFSPWKRVADIDDSVVSSEETWSSNKISKIKNYVTIPLKSFTDNQSLSSTEEAIFWDNAEFFKSLVMGVNITRWRYILTGVSQGSGTLTIGNATISLTTDEVGIGAAYPHASNWVTEHCNKLVNIGKSTTFYPKELSIQIEYTI